MFDFFGSSTWELILAFCFFAMCLRDRKQKNYIDELEEENEHLKSIINQKHT